jgi:hypothetical protein
MYLWAVEDYRCEGFYYDTEERVPTIHVGVAVAAITIVIVVRDDLCITHALRYCSLLPAL